MYLHAKLLLLAVIITVLSGCAAGQRHFSVAQDLEEQGRHEEAMYRYAEALKADPTAAEYRLRFLKSRDKAAQAHASKGDALYAAGNYKEALVAYQAAGGLDAGTARYAQKAERAAQMRDAQAAWQEGQELERAKRLRDAARAYAIALEIDPKNADYRTAAKRVAEQRKSRLDSYELKLKSTAPFTLKFQNASLKEVFNVVTRLSGINFIFDEAVKEQPVTLHLENATFYQALELLTSMYKLGRKNLNEGTVILYPRTTEKAKQYEDMVIRTFTLNYLDGKKAINLIRSLLQVRKLSLNEETNALVLRDTAEVAAVVEKIIEANDVPDAEVVLEVEVVEFNDKDTKNVGLLLSNYSASLGTFTPDSKLLSPYLFPPSGLSTPVDTSQLLKAFSIKGFGGYVTVPNATYNFGKTMARGEILSNPKLRVKNKEKAKFTVGQRVPIQTTSSTGTITSTNVQYVDVGIKMNAEPTIQLSNEVSVRLGLEVSSVITKETSKTDGTTLLTIGTRNLDTVLSLKDGETVIIGGLIQNSDTTDKSKVFLLGDLPLIGPFVSNTNSSRDKSELLLAITPRLVRRVTVPSSPVASFLSGKEEAPSLVSPYASFELEPEYRGEPEKPKQPAPAATGTAPSAAPQPAAAAPTAAAPAAAGKARQTGKATLGFQAPATVAVGNALQLTVTIADAELLSQAAFTVEYDPELLTFSNATEGDLLKRDGTATSFQHIPGKPGSISFTLQRASGASGVTGEGSLAQLNFVSKKAGPAGFAFSSTTFIRQDGTPQPLVGLSSFVDLTTPRVD